MSIIVIRWVNCFSPNSAHTPLLSRLLVKSTLNLIGAESAASLIPLDGLQAPFNHFYPIVLQ